MYFLVARLGPPTAAELLAMAVRKAREFLPFGMIVVHTIPIILAIVLLNKYFFKSAEGIDGAING